MKIKIPGENPVEVSLTGGKVVRIPGRGFLNIFCNFGSIGNDLLMENNDYLMLESNDHILMEV